ncbi:MAG: ABC transporter permease, partial [Christensenellaceae bacterium]
MIKLDNITNEILDKIDPIGFEQKGAFNLRYNGAPLCHSNSENIRIEKKTDKQGIDIFISSKCRGEYVHIPVVMNETGLTDVVYNDFFVEDGADVI